MRKILTAICLLAFSAIGHSQALYPVSMDEKIQQSTHIIEGKVVEQRSFWNPKHTMIFTTNKVAVYKVFKGNTTAAFIEVLTVGGSVGLEGVEASDLLTLDMGNTGIFFCFANSIDLRSPVTGNLLFDVYSSAQGSITYDMATKAASAPFVRYASIENDLYRELTQKIGHQPVVINSAFNVATPLTPMNIQAPAITSFSPAVVNSGALLDPVNNILTITGTGFGATPAGLSAVTFDDANNGTGGTAFSVAYTSPLIVSWTDTEIKLNVPARAGTGFFQVIDEFGSTSTSPVTLSVNLAFITGSFTSGGISVVKEYNLMNQNGLGGYSFVYSTNTAGSGIDITLSPELGTFLRAANTWKETVGLNIAEAGVTTIQNPTNDNTNIIVFDNSNTGTTPLASGVLAVCYSFLNMCTPITTNQAQRTGFDIVIRNNGFSSGSTNFTSGPCAPQSPFTQIDLETVLLHELGHAIGMAHINETFQGSFLPNINPAKLMNFAVVNGVSRKSPDFSAYYGALYCITPQNNLYGNCTLPGIEMTPLVVTPAPMDECPVNFPATVTPNNTVLNFNLVHATSNKNGDPQYTAVNCAGTGTHVTNNAYYAIKTGTAGDLLNLTVSNYATFPADVQACAGAGIRLALYQVNSCPAGQSFPAPFACRTFNANGALTAITGLLPNTSYLLYVDGLNNTKANFTFTLGGTVLPVTLVDFKGKLTGANVDLSWKTSEEINSKEFIVEKSLDGSSFSTFDVVAAKGNSAVENNYNLTDRKPFPDFTFYRLKINDRDGQFKYSPIIKIKTQAKSIAITKVYPNPARNSITLQVVSDSRRALFVEAFDLAGLKVLAQQVNVDKGINEKLVSVNRLASGTYILQVSDADGNVVEKTKFLKN